MRGRELYARDLNELLALGWLEADEAEEQQAAMRKGWGHGG